MYEDHGKPEGTVWDPRLLPLTIGTTCGTNTPPDVARRLLNIKPSALPRWGEGGAIRSLAVEREGTTSNGVGGATQYVDEGRVGGARACLHAETPASLTGTRRTKARPGTSSISRSSNNAKVREGVAPPRFCFFFLPALRASRGAALRPPPFPVRPPRGGRTPRGNGGPQSGFVGQNLVFWIIALNSAAIFDF